MKLQLQFQLQLSVTISYIVNLVKWLRLLQSCSIFSQDSLKELTK